MVTISDDQKQKYINEYLETYSVSELLKRYQETDNINRKKLVNLLKDSGVYEGLNGPNYLKKKTENHKKLMMERYGVENWGQVKGEGWDKLNSIPYNKIDVLDTKYKKYRDRVTKLQKKYLDESIKLGTVPDYCEYTGILFADTEYENVNPNDPRKRTIDHKVPVIYCYLNDVSIKDCATPENMVFVLRYVNSIKGNTLHESFVPIAEKIRKVFINEGYKSK